MYAVVAMYPQKGMELIGFASSKEEVEEKINAYKNEKGEETLRKLGVYFNIELAF